MLDFYFFYKTNATKVRSVDIIVLRYSRNEKLTMKT